MPANISISRAPRGFTIVEMVVTLIIIGILAAVVVPRFGHQGFPEAAFRDQTLALLRYAQKMAIAQRRNVCASFTASSVTLTIASARGDGAACNTALTGPDGRVPAGVSAAAGVSYGATPTAFTFRARGDTSLAAAQVISVNGAGTVTVEPTTGYVH